MNSLYCHADITDFVSLEEIRDAFRVQQCQSKQWLLNNIDVEAYRKEAAPLLENQIARISKNSYSGSEEEQTIERLKKHVDWISFL